MIACTSFGILLQCSLLPITTLTWVEHCDQFLMTRVQDSDGLFLKIFPGSCLQLIALLLSQFLALMMKSVL